MSDHEERTSDHGYDAPLPELDDHRHQTSSIPRLDRQRRGTFDSLYGARQAEHGGSSVHHHHPYAAHGREVEEAVDDEEAGDVSPLAHRSRRPTVESLDQRSVSPPNSVKAFAAARRRERQMSDSEPADRRPDEQELQRAISVASRRSHRSRPHTVADDAASLATNKSAEEDVCYPLQDEQHRKDTLYIDFDYLENFIRAESESRAAVRDGHRGGARPAGEPAKVFTDLRSDHPSGSGPNYVATADGDILEMPSDATLPEEKQGSVDENSPGEDRDIDPNKYSFFSSAWESTIHAAEFGDLVLPGEDIRGLFSFPPDETDGVWWLNINQPSHEVVRAICRAFGVHPLSIEDITTQESREKIELFPSYYFACFRSFTVKDDNKEKPHRDRTEGEEPIYVPFNLYVIVFREGTLSFSYAKNSHAAHVRNRISMLKDYVSLSSDWICYAIIDDIVDSFAPVIGQIERESDQIEDDVFVARKDDMNKFLRKIGTVRKNVMSLLRLLGGKADVLRGFTKRCNENYKVTPRMDIGLYLGDIQDHVVTMTTNLGHVEKILSRSHSNYLAQLSIDSITQGTSTNKGLSKITLLASIIVPLNVVTGLFGMNVLVPWRDVDSLSPFYGIVGGLGFCVVVLIVAARYFRYV